MMTEDQFYNLVSDLTKAQVKWLLSDLTMCEEALHDILHDGFKGFLHYTEEELIAYANVMGIE